MSHKVITAVVTEPVTLAQAKLHLRVDSSSDDDLITALISAAREMAEHHADRAFAAATLEAAFDGFPEDDRFLVLPLGPVASVTSLKYDDAAGSEQTLSTSDYSLSSYGPANTVNLTADAEWPSTEEAAESVRVRYVTPATCPKAAYAAMLLIIGHLYEHREAVAAGTVTEVPMGAKALLDTVKVYG